MRSQALLDSEIFEYYISEWSIIERQNKQAVVKEKGWKIKASTLMSLDGVMSSLLYCT